MFWIANHQHHHLLNSLFFPCCFYSTGLSVDPCTDTTLCYLLELYGKFCYLIWEGAPVMLLVFWSCTMSMNQKTHYYKMSILPKWTYKLNTHSIKNSSGLFLGVWKQADSKIYMEMQRVQNSQSNSEKKKEQSWEDTDYLISVLKIMWYKHNFWTRLFPEIDLHVGGQLILTKVSQWLRKRLS